MIFQLFTTITVTRDAENIVFKVQILQNEKNNAFK